MKLNLFIIIFLVFFASSCREPKKFGNLQIIFTHTIDNQPIEWNKLGYTNAAGNQYQLNEIKYFISRVYLNTTDGNKLKMYEDERIHYVDCSLPNTLNWIIEDISIKNYIGISFVFGLNDQDNFSNRFVNPPECNFSWPEYLGGGYHYMQINGKYMNNRGELQNMNIHTGIGQRYNENHEITEFVQNYFMVTLPINFTIHEDQTTTITLNMEIQRWFDTPNIYDFNEFGAEIMHNEQAQELLKENGGNVFEVSHSLRFFGMSGKII